MSTSETKIRKSNKKLSATDKEVPENLHPGAALIVTTLKGQKAPISKKELVALLEGKFESKQSTDRIVSYWKKFLIDNGYVTVISDTPAAAA